MTSAPQKLRRFRTVEQMLKSAVTIDDYRDAATAAAAYLAEVESLAQGLSDSCSEQRDRIKRLREGRPEFDS